MRNKFRKGLYFPPKLDDNTTTDLRRFAGSVLDPDPDPARHTVVPTKG